MIGAFVQINMQTTNRWKAHPIGYVVAENGCWLWVGNLINTGYGRVTHDGQEMLAHRFMYEKDIGPIPAGLDLDHLCRNRSCVRPSHLQPVTRRENLLRGETLPAREVVQTQCKRGHPFTPENTRIRTDRGGARQCRACDRLHEQRRVSGWERSRRKDRQT